jgi:hypothetical protein
MIGLGLVGPSEQLTIHLALPPIRSTLIAPNPHLALLCSDTVMS